jgi:hypothetical protein
MSSALAHALTQYIDTHGGDEGLIATPIGGLGLLRKTDGLLPSHAMYRPSSAASTRICLVPPLNGMRWS